MKRRYHGRARGIMKVVAFAIAPVMMHRRHDWNTTAYAFRHRALQRGLPWKRRGRHDGFSMTSSVGSKAQEPYTAYLVQANTDRTSFTYVLSFFFHAVKLRNIDAWNPTYGETLRRNWKKILKITNACSANVLTLCILWNMNFEWNLENNFFVIKKKKKSREVENLSRYWNGFFRKYTRFIGIPAIFLVF